MYIYISHIHHGIYKTSYNWDILSLWQPGTFLPSLGFSGGFFGDFSPLAETRLQKVYPSTSPKILGYLMYLKNPIFLIFVASLFLG